MYLFDTNIFLEIFLDQEKADICQNALGSLTVDKPGWVTAFSVHAIEALLGQTSKRRKLLDKFLQYLEVEDFLSRYATTLEEEKKILTLTGVFSLDFDDALQYFVAKRLDVSLVTLDQDFQRVTGIRVLSPSTLCVGEFGL